MSRSTIRTSWRRSGALLLAAVIFPASAQAQVRDWVYVHCSGAGGDFRISELSHRVSQFSIPLQGYRATCAECQVVEWGDRISLLDANGSRVQLDRVSGQVSIRQRGSATTAPVSYDGICARGSYVSGKPSRAF